MCIRDRDHAIISEIDGEVSFGKDTKGKRKLLITPFAADGACLLYTSDAADERSSVDLGGRRIIKKKKSETALE